MEKQENGFLGKLKNDVANVLLERRWVLLFLLAASALIFEILEHQDVDHPIDAHFVREIVLFVIIYPLAFGLLLNTLLKTQRQRDLLLRQQEIKQNLNRLLMSASTWRELCNRIVSFPATETSAAGVCLYLLSEENNALHMEADWWLEKPPRRPVLQNPLPLDCCGVANHVLEPHLHPCLSHNGHSSPLSSGYCLPLVKDHHRLGLMYLYMASSECLSPVQIDLLNSISPTVALAIESMRAKQQLESHAEAIQNERERIARQLHDTLGQNLAYLRLKLDQMSMENTLSTIAVVQQDLERMRDIAYEAHEQVRQTLVSLKPEGSACLTDLLLAQSRAVAQQAGFSVHPHIVGEAVPLPSTVQRKIHAIFREALHNVERHAHADTVHLSIYFDACAASLIVSLEDDGVGFALDQVRSNGHFGLLIMQQRAEEISGQLTIETAPYQGTRVVLHYPLPQTQSAPVDLV